MRSRPQHCTCGQCDDCLARRNQSTRPRRVRDSYTIAERQVARAKEQALFAEMDRQEAAFNRLRNRLQPLGQHGPG